uniref:Uncharacterized protein n=1 Tax=Panagrolaimus sp. JU765 TaxID=591449 RepID=A0AC34R0Q6_9BILA
MVHIYLKNKCPPNS